MCQTRPTVLPRLFRNMSFFWVKRHRTLIRCLFCYIHTNVNLMADIFKGILGPMRGKIGAVVGRYMYGKGLVQSKGQMGVKSGRIDESPAQIGMKRLRALYRPTFNELLSYWYFPKSKKLPLYQSWIRDNWVAVTNTGELDFNLIKVTTGPELKMSEVSVYLNLGTEDLYIEWDDVGGSYGVDDDWTVVFWLLDLNFLTYQVALDGTPLSQTNAGPYPIVIDESHTYQCFIQAIKPGGQVSSASLSFPTIPV